MSAETREILARLVNPDDDFDIDDAEHDLELLITDERDYGYQDGDSVGYDRGVNDAQDEGRNVILAPATGADYLPRHLAALDRLGLRPVRQWAESMYYSSDEIAADSIVVEIRKGDIEHAAHI